VEPDLHWDGSCENPFSHLPQRESLPAHLGTFVWADSTNADFASTGVNQFLIRVSGGVGIGTNNPLGFQLAVNGTAAKTGGGSYFRHPHV